VEHPRQDFWVHHETTMEAANFTVGFTVGFTMDFAVASSMDKAVDPP
jgi:hypothetical protein